MSSPASSPEVCPPPLMWQDVRREYLAQSEHLPQSTSSGPVSVRMLGNGPALYLLPGFSEPAELFCLLVWLLKDEFRCVTVESDWAARSPAAQASNPTLFDDADRLFSVADELGDDSFCVFGSNVGAACGLAAAARQPQRIARLMLLQGFLHRRLSFFERQLAWWCGFSGRTLAAIPQRGYLQTQNHRRWFPPFDETRWQYFLEATGQMPLKELSRRAAAVSHSDLRPEAGAICTPALVIHTEGDGGLAEACNQELERLLPNTKPEWLHNAGQLAYLTHPHRLAKLIRAFCAEAVSSAPDKSLASPGQLQN